MKPKLTGSQVYGTPRHDSDIDLVLYFDTHQELGLLAAFADTAISHKQIALDKQYNGVSLRFGRLNIIGVVGSLDTYEAWVKGTEFLEKIKPVTKEMACEIFETMFKIVSKKNENDKKSDSLPF